MAPLSKHGSDVVSLVAGLIFLGIAGRWALGGTDLLPGNGGWLLPVILIAAGVAGLLSARRRQREADDEGERDADRNADRNADREGGQA
ncbi:MAG: hypothetical protein DLM59_16270 [Pseudonocardiales bacterium]|nr:MAG: hypothetical protein DLM59_16270 [Pseudonocardiales bacterium]